MLWWSIRATGYGFQSWLRISTPEKIVHVANTFQSVYFKQHSSLDVYLFRFYHFAITGWDFVLFCKFFVYCVTVIRCVYPGQACLAMRQESRRAMPSYTQLTITYHQMQLLMNGLSHIPGFQTKKTIVTGNGIYLMRPWLSLNTIWYHVITIKSGISPSHYIDHLSH